MPFGTGVSLPAGRFETSRESGTSDQCQTHSSPLAARDAEGIILCRGRRNARAEAQMMRAWSPTMKAYS